MVDRAATTLFGAITAASVVIAGVATIYEVVFRTANPWLYPLYVITITVAAVYLAYERVVSGSPAGGAWPAFFAVLAVLTVLISGFGIGLQRGDAGSAAAADPDADPLPLLAVDPIPRTIVGDIDVSGDVSGLKNGETLWVFVSSENDDQHYLQPGPCVVDASPFDSLQLRWQCSGVRIVPPGQTNVRVVRASSEAGRAFVDVWRAIAADRDFSRQAYDRWPPGTEPSRPAVAQR